MARKNSNAGQPNRVAQANRRVQRKNNAEIYDRRRVFQNMNDPRVLGPLSENLSPQPRVRDLETTVVPIVRELASA